MVDEGRPREHRSPSRHFPEHKTSHLRHVSYAQYVPIYNVRIYIFYESYTYKIYIWKYATLAT